MLKRQRLEELVLEKLKTVPEKPAKVSFHHKQNYWIGDENLTGGKILVLVGPSPSPRWEREGQRMKRRTMFVGVRIVAACDQQDAARIEKLIDFSERLLNHVACMDIDDDDHAAYCESAEFDTTSDPLNYDYLANNRFFTSFTLEFRDQELFERE